MGALEDVVAERARQDAKWGEQNHDPFTYLTVLTEEVGELSQAALHARFGGPAADGLRTEAVHVAAVALAIVECVDRGLWQWDGVSMPQVERRFLALAIQGLCMRQGPDAFALAARVSRTLSLTTELGESLTSWIDYAKDVHADG